MMHMDIGIIGAMQPEIDDLLCLLEDPKTDRIGGQIFHTGRLDGKNVAIVRCGIGKVFAALTAEAMILRYAPRLLINTGVAGALSPDLFQGDVVVAQDLCQHDMDTTVLGDPKGMISGLDRVFLPADEGARAIVCALPAEGFRIRAGRIASGDRFVSTEEEKARIAADFSAVACEMEGGAIAQVAFVNQTPVCVIRAISDGADEAARLSFDRFLPLAAGRSAAITRELVRRYEW